MADPSQNYGSYAGNGNNHNNNNNNNNNYSYGGGGTTSPSYGGGASYPSYTAPIPTSSASASPHDGLRRRVGHASSNEYYQNGVNSSDSSSKGHAHHRMVQKLDILFPKVDQEFTVSSGNGNWTLLITVVVLSILCSAELIAWMSQNGTMETTTRVDTSLNQPMRINLNVTFPALACENLHVDIIDVAGDSQLNVEDTLTKKKLHLNGRVFSHTELDVETNQHRQQQQEKQRVLQEKLPDDYCGPCYGAHQKEGQCCQTCDALMEAYKLRHWKADMLKFTAEQCIREGRDKVEPSKMVKGQGCHLTGYMMVNRVSGNFHIAMGEGVERDGRHIHTYLPEDARNFNASHIIHELSFGPQDGNDPLNGVTKIVTDDTGTTGLFQYFIKVVPTTYFANAIPTAMAAEAAKRTPNTTTSTTTTTKETFVETNRYFVTERFLPLMTELLEDQHRMGKEDFHKAAVHAGHGGEHSNQEHHRKQNAVLPGVFFIYEIYPFAVEIRKASVSWTHLWIRLLATVGGVVTVARWADSWWYDRKETSRRSF